MMKKIKTILVVLISYFYLASSAIAATAFTTSAGNCSISGMTTLKDIILKFVIGCILSRTALLLIAISVVVFLWGVSKYIRAEGDNRQSGRELMFWGIVGLFVMTSVWGLVYILQSTFNLSGDYDITPRPVNIQNITL